MSMNELAMRAGYSRQFVSQIFSSEQLGSDEAIAALDRCLHGGGVLIDLHRAARQEQVDMRREHLATPHKSRADDVPSDTKTHIAREQQEWLEIRRAAGARGRELSELAAWLYPADLRGPGGHVLTPPGWLLHTPIELDDVTLIRSRGQWPRPKLDHHRSVLPLADDGTRYASYSRAVRDLVRPRLLENRPSYRLLDVTRDSGLKLTFGMTSFFETFDVKQSIAHEFKAAWRASHGGVPDWQDLPIRRTLGIELNPTKLLMSPGISTLTLRRGRSGQHRFVLHERDGGKVADGGGLCHVMPAGEFQPSSLSPVDIERDFSLWRNIAREYAEEFLGTPERDGFDTEPQDYMDSDPYRALSIARTAGRLRVYHYGLVIEPLELGALQLTVAVVDERTFDDLFGAMVETNDEGHVVRASGRADLPFTAEAIDRLSPRLSGSALTLLQLAWRDRHLLLPE
jgi:hypothetical protein